MAYATEAEAPMVQDLPGRLQDKVTAATTPGVTYSTTFDQATGVYEVTAEAQEGYRFPAGAQTVFTGTLTGLVTPQAPTVVDKAGTSEDSITPATTEGVTYAVTFDRKTGAYTVVATPQEGYSFPSNAQTVWSGNLATHVTMERPREVTSTAVTAPITPGLTYQVTIDQQARTWTLVATPQEGYILDGPPTMAGPLTSVAIPPAPRVVSMSPPQIQDLQGWTRDRVAAPKTKGITYNLSYNQRSGRWVLVATPLPGYALSGPSRLEGVLDVRTPAPLVTRRFQVDKYAVKTKAQVNTLSALMRSGVLRYRGDRTFWGASSHEFATVTLPATATPGEWLKALNKSTSSRVGDLNTTRRITSVRRGSTYTVAWELGRGASPRDGGLAWGKNHKVPQTFAFRR